MKSVTALTPDQLCPRCDPDSLGIATTADVREHSRAFGQDRALEAARVGLGIKHTGYNIFAMGPSGLGKRRTIEELLTGRAHSDPTPQDWCYVYNFARPDAPCALPLPAGRGRDLASDMEGLVESLKIAVPEAFESEEYQTRLQELQDEVRETRQSAFEKVAEEAAKHNIQFLRTPSGVAFAPTRDGEVMNPEAFAEIPQEEQAEIQKQIDSLQESVQAAMREAIRGSAASYEAMKALNKEIALAAVGEAIAALRSRWGEDERVAEYLAVVAADMVEHADAFRRQPEESTPALPFLAIQNATVTQRYKVNVLVDRANETGAPIVYEDHPTYQNLVGRVEHRAHFGTLETDFTLIKAGALHRANGGYLLLDARKLLMQPYAWEGLKSALRTRSVRIESLGEALSLAPTKTLQPQEIPLETKVVLIGDRYLYYALYSYDPEFAELFKIGADFEENIKRDETSIAAYVNGVAAAVNEEQLRPFDKTAVARVIDASTRTAHDSEKLSLLDAWIRDLAREADFIAATAKCETVSAEHVRRAIELRNERNGRVRSQVLEAIARDTVLIDTDGAKVAQVNGLSVLAVGEFAFGQPSRITATARLGQGHVVDIEREVDLGGSHHSKGVLILSNFLADRYARERPLALSASLTFEQSYGRVDGDSASTAELCALLSAVAERPVKQSLAITGSVNQKGEVQAIGGVNEKIEGFFDVCRQRELSGEQGVIIPRANVKHLTLREDVVEAVADGRFHVYAVDHVDEAAELLMEIESGERGEDGSYPAGSLNRLVDDRLEAFYELRRADTQQASLSDDTEEENK